MPGTRKESPVRAVSFLATFGLLALGVAGCGGGESHPPTADPAMQANRLVGTAWELALIQLPGRQRVPVDDPGDYRVAYVEKTRLVVQVGSNRCTGHYNSQGRALTVQLDCPAGFLPPGSVGQEFLAVLRSASHFGMTGSGQEMYIDSATSGASLSFRRVKVEDPPSNESTRRPEG
jgi:hypothetical protein